jgi:threonine/homoserine/homoserine lactone efflux protein
MDPGKIATFALVTTLTSITPGPSMMFIMTQSIWRGGRNALIALAGLQAGNLTWFAMAALGLGTLLQAAPLAFTVLAMAGGLYLAWLGLQALRNAAFPSQQQPVASSRPAGQAMRAGYAVSLGNPKSIVYVTALLPPFVTPGQAIMPQLALLAVIALVIDVAVSIAYILAGKRLSAAMTRPEVRRRLDFAVGTVFLLIAAYIIWQGLAGLRSAALGA